MSPPPSGVLVMAYGTPASPADIEDYYTHIRGGRPPTTEQLADLTRRYDAIGGFSPLLARTRAQADGLGAALGPDFTVKLGCKHSPPFIEDAVDALIDGGVQRAIGLVLAPHYSSLSVGQYALRAVAAAGDRMQLAMVDDWHLAPGYIDLLARFVADAHTGLTGAGSTHTVFTAHSLPARILASDDPYPSQLAETAEAVAAQVGLAPDSWSVGWQSAGRTPEPWIGPDILVKLADLATAGVTRVVVCPAGFTSDHLEVLFDLDIEARAVADRLGLAFTRTRSLNDHPQLCATLADIVQAAAQIPNR